MNRISVLLVDDHSIVRQGCRKVLEQRGDLTIVGEAATGEEALTKIKTLKPTVVFLDLSLPGLGGIETTRRIKADYPLVRTIILTFHTEEMYVYRALEAGAAAYVTKQGGAQELEDALEAVLKEQMYLSPLISRSVVESYLKRASHSSMLGKELLTAKEIEVLKLLTEGLTSKEIGHHLHTSSLTIDVHRRNIMKKLNIRSLPGLVKWAIRNNMVSVEEMG
jgi:DNA-binding NarL/FixJ family response regulator